MSGRSLRIARIAGIPVGISPWWLVIVALLTWSLGTDYFDERAPGLAPAATAALALGSVLTVFAGVLAHEFGHALVARRAGVTIDEIDLWLLGGVARMRNQPRRAVDELRFALAGPAVTALIALAFAVVAWWLPPATPDAWRAFVDYQVQVNVAIAVFNLLPALPLDGGRAARAIIWRRTGDLRGATVIAASGGRAIGYGLAWLGLLAVLAGYLIGVWAAIVGMFLVAAGAAEKHQVELGAALANLTTGDVMSAPAVVLAARLARADARAAAAEHGFACYPVVDGDGTAVGLLRVADLNRSGGGETVGDLAIPAQALLLRPDEPAAALLENADFSRVGRAIVVDSGKRPLGVISMGDLERRLRPRTPAKPGGRPATGAIQ